ncbi:hypothetical protein XELAEV_18003386mg [Xenopus laevis]|nr:hypothetical protein XELAEV_18003386mg [Xenopus laevis]
MYRCVGVLVYQCVGVSVCECVYQCISVSVCQCIGVLVYCCISVSVCRCIGVSVCECVCQCISVSVCQCIGVLVYCCISVSVCRCIGVSVCRCIIVSVCVSVYQCVSVCQCIGVSVYWCISVSVYQCVSVCVSVSVCQCVYQCVSVCQCITVSVYQCVGVSVCRCISVSVVSVYQCVYEGRVEAEGEFGISCRQLSWVTVGFSLQQGLDDEDSGQEPITSSADFPGEELEVSAVAETFARGCDCVSISSFPGERLIPGKEDTASLVSTATLVPECIYFPPSGYQLVPEQEVTEQKLALQSVTERLERVMREKETLQDALRCSSDECATQVQVLLDQIKSSEELLQNLQRTLTDTQQKTARQMATLTATFNRLCQEVNCLNEENEKLRALSSATAPEEQRVTVEPSPTQRAAQHRQERLCIEIVSLQEELKLEQQLKRDLEEQLRMEKETHTEEREIMEGDHSLQSEDRNGADSAGEEAGETDSCTKSELQLQESESQVQKLWESMGEHEKLFQQEKEGKICLQAALTEEKTKVSRLQTELGTSEEVQRDFVRLSQALQVSLEKIRQADSMEDVFAILEGTRLTDINQLQES